MVKNNIGHDIRLFERIGLYLAIAEEIESSRNQVLALKTGPNFDMEFGPIFFLPLHMRLAKIS